MKGVFLVAIGLLLNTASAWNFYGHVIVARIPYDLLKEDSPTTITKVDKVLKYLHTSDPDGTAKEGKYPLVECATYADDIKYHGGMWQQWWHFLDSPWYDEGDKDLPYKPPTHNITEALDALVAWINKESGYKNTYIY